MTSAGAETSQRAGVRAGGWLHAASHPALHPVLPAAVIRGGGHTVLAAISAVVGTATPGTAFHPTPTQLPGGAALQRLVNGVGGWALILSLAGLVVGAAMWALGAHAQNYQQSFVGRRAVLVSGLAALIIGAAPVIIDFFFHTGMHIPLPS